MAQYVTDAQLLHDELRHGAQLHTISWGASQYLALAAAIAAWNSFQHTMRQLLPVENWVGGVPFETTFRELEDIAPRDLRFDRRVVRTHTRKRSSWLGFPSSTTSKPVGLSIGASSSATNIGRAALAIAASEATRATLLSLATGRRCDGSSCTIGKGCWNEFAQELAV